MRAIGYRSASHLWWAEAYVDRLRRLVGPLQPAASFYLGGRRFGIDAEEDLNLRIASLVRQLKSEGVDQPTASALRSYATRLDTEHGAHAAFARDGFVLYKQTVVDAEPFDLARFAAPPVVAPMLRWLYERPPYVVVVTDRAGAEITGAPGAGGPRLTTTVVGPDDEITAKATRGWSQPRHQRRVESSWRHNAAAVVDAALVAAEQIRAKLVLVAGDARAARLVREGLHRQRPDLSVRGLATGRPGELPAAVTAAVADETTARVDDLLRQLRDGGGPAGLATEGAAETLAALATGRADDLVVVDDLADSRLAWFSTDVLCSLGRPAGAPEAVRGRLVDVAVRAALLTDGQVCVIPAGLPLAPAEGIGATCRYPLRSD
jgi:hypothetical protein